MVIKFNTNNFDCPSIQCLPITRHRMNFSITCSAYRASHVLNPRWTLHVPPAHTFILICCCKVQISQSQYSSTQICFPILQGKSIYIGAFRPSLQKVSFSKPRQTLEQQQIITEPRSHSQHWTISCNTQFNTCVCTH